MKKLTSEQRKEFDLLEANYYVTRAQVKRERILFKRIAISSVAFGLLAIITAMLLSFYALATSREAKKIQTVIYLDDGKGAITLMHSLHDSANFPLDEKKLESYTKNQLSEYLKALYSVPNSREMTQANIYKVLYMTQKDYYPKVPQQIFKGNLTTGNNPGVITIEVTSGSLVSPQVWQFNWTKKLNSDQIGKFKSWITFKQEDIKNEIIANYNPLGIVVTNIDTQADI